MRSEMGNEQEQHCTGRCNDPPHGLIDDVLLMFSLAILTPVVVRYSIILSCPLTTLQLFRRLFGVRSRGQWWGGSGKVSVDRNLKPAGGRSLSARHRLDCDQHLFKIK